MTTIISTSQDIEMRLKNAASLLQAAKHDEQELFVTIDQEQKALDSLDTRFAQYHEYIFDLENSLKECHARIEELKLSQTIATGTASEAHIGEALASRLLECSATEREIVEAQAELDELPGQTQEERAEHEQALAKHTLLLLDVQKRTAELEKQQSALHAELGMAIYEELGQELTSIEQGLSRLDAEKQSLEQQRLRTAHAMRSQLHKWPQLAQQANARAKPILLSGEGLPRLLEAHEQFLRALEQASSIPPRIGNVHTHEFLSFTPATMDALLTMPPAKRGEWFRMAYLREQSLLTDYFNSRHV